VIEFGAPLVKNSSAYAQFFRQIADIIAAPHALDAHSLKLP
jgi:hypothetical protein